MRTAIDPAVAQSAASALQTSRGVALSRTGRSQGRSHATG